MSGLPPALAPWAEPLAPFAPDLALVLGEWARRLAPALGPIPRRQASPGEPDGLAGLARRGSYERLLLSEWLLADELPDEFLRRAAAQEHLFLAAGRRGGGAGLRSVALFDAGPEQLGAPRIAQLATLVVLAARAQAAGAELLWGTVQDTGLELRSGFSAELAFRFLGGRSRRPAGDAALAPWRERLAGVGGHDDAWLVGGPSLAGSSAIPGALRLCVEEVIDPALRQVRLTLSAGGVRRREVVLELPAPADCVRLVRDPFRAAQPEPRRVPGRPVARAGLRFSPGGRRAALRLDGAGLLEFAIPSSARARPPGRTRVVSGGPGLVAVGWQQNRAVLATLGGGHLLVGRHGSAPMADCKPGRGVPMPSAPLPTDPMGALEFALGQLWLLDGAGVLFHGPWIPRAGRSTPELWIASVGVTALLVARDLVAYTARQGGGAVELVMHSRTGRAVEPLGPGTGRAHLAGDAAWLVLAAEEPSGTWRLAQGHPGAGRQGIRLLRPPSDTEVMGLARAGDGPALLLLEADRRDFTLLSARGLRLALGAAAPVASATVSGDGRRLAYLTSAGAVHVWSLDRGEPLLHLLAGAPA